jgi:hypothetical protein
MVEKFIELIFDESHVEGSGDSNHGTGYITPTTAAIRAACAVGGRTGP